MRKEKEAKDLVKRCETLRIDMTKDEVLQIMGPPINVVEMDRDGDKKERLIFLSPRLASTYTQCVVDKKTMLLEEIICGEGYRLVKRLKRVEKENQKNQVPVTKKRDTEA